MPAGGSQTPTTGCARSNRLSLPPRTRGACRLPPPRSRGGVPAPRALEAGLIAARSDVTLAETVLDKTRIRAPIAGTVLQINAKLGELVAPSVEFPLAVMGDMSIARVRAEVDEPDVSKIKKDQRVFVKNTAYANREFDGKVVEIAPSLAMPRMGSRGARRAT